ncbi:MAG TPA: helicase C-terminal domain-containing protein [Chloroflexota bacterium]|nr:helicase C-terminal domain-containing protein [Chloroflexota bacterium]
MSQICVSIDLEMTSARPENQEVIEIAAIKFRDDRVLDSWSTLVRPQTPVPYGTQVLTGIDPGTLRRAPVLSEVAGQLLSFVERHPLVAHSVGSDVGCLRRQGVILDNPQYDTFELASILLPQMSSYSLASLTEALGIQFPKQHRATHDALATKQLFLKLVEVANDLDLGLIQEINRLLANHTWPLKALFYQIEVEQSRNALGSSIRQAMAAKAGLEETDLELLLAPARGEEPVRPAKTLTPIDANHLVAMLEPGGLFAQKLPGFEHREPQVEMVRAVTEALNDGKQLIVEAGTGTGKSVAYSLPAIYFAIENGQRVVVSTNTINLQDQLILKDLPDLQRILPINFRATVVKGRTNYLCLQRLKTLRNRKDLSPTETLALIKILVWLPSTETGDQSELNLTDAERAVWSRLYAHPDICTPNTCRYARRGRCFLYRARARAEAAHVVVVNHALLLSDVASASKVLPEYEYLIVDEAHHLEEQATDQLGYALRAREVIGFLDDLAPGASNERRSGLLGELGNYFRGSSCPPEAQRRAEEYAREAMSQAGEVRAAVDGFFQTLTSFMAQRPLDNRGYEQRARLTSAARRQPSWGNVEVAWESLELRLIALQEQLSKLHSLLDGLSSYNLLEYDELMSQLTSLLSFNEGVRTHGNAIVANPSEEQIYWATLSATGDASLHSAPLNVGSLLQQELYSDKRTVVLTSATLTTVGTFTYMKDRLGLADADELAVGSPFDYQRSTLLVVPGDMPEPDQPTYQRALHQTLERLCLETEGRTLVLFTSHAQLRAAWQAIHQPLAAQGILVLGHGVDGTPRRQLLNTFKSNQKTVLLGASSFWEGIDVVGDALSVLVIARLPFSVPSDPVFAARSELFDDPFGQYSLPQTILRFRQGFGRLIRSSTDRGVIVILDRRVQSKSYGPNLLKSLPTCTQHPTTLAKLPAVAREWLEQRLPEPVG